MADFTAVVALTSLDGTTGTQITGEAAANYAGQSIANVGDINGDGIDDFAVGATGVGGGSQGAVYVVFGSASGFPANFNFNTLTGANGFQVNGGEYAQDFVGVSVSSAGDVNNDGIADLLIGASGADPDGGGSGAAYILYGKNTALDGNFASDIATSSLTGTTGFQISGTNGGDGLGFSVAMGDFNGDGIDDMLIGANQADSYRGGGYVIFGKDTAVNGAFAGNIDVATLDGTNGFKMPAINAYDYVGTSVANAGDVNGDGIDDIMITAIGADPNGSNSGAAYIIFGKNTGFTASVSLSALNGADGFRISGLASGDQTGISSAGIGDVNEDGIDDILIGANGLTNNGGAFVVFGRNTALNGNFASNVNVSSLNGTNGYRIDGESAGDNLGIRVAGLGDVNGDGINDFIVGATGKDDAGSNAGAAYVIFGGSGVGSAGTVSLAGLNGTNGFQINGEAAGDNLSRVAGWGDFNNDGGMDILVSTSFHDAGGNNSGAAWIIYGFPSETLVGTAGDDDLTGTGIDDTGDGGDGEDILRGEGGADTLSGGAAKDELYGGADNDTLSGDAGNDLLDGGTGADNLAGGTGDDTYVVDNIGDLVTEGAGEGSDRIRATISVTLTANFENLQLTGSADIDGTGNASANQIDGNSGANVIDGGGGNDIIRGNAGSDDLSGNTGVDQLLGGDGDDTIYGGDANDIIQGNADSDTLYGGAGVDSLDGGTEIDFLYGEAGNDKLLGGDGDDQLFGGADNDQLTGGAGSDTLTGGTGDDTYFITDFTDTLVEASGEGNDIVKSTVSWTLGDNFERLILEGGGDIIGTGNALANQLTGNSGMNSLYGGDGADILNGALGDDALIGGLGNDTLIGGGGADIFIIEQQSLFTSSNPGGRTIETDNVNDYALGLDSIDFASIDAIAATGGVNDAFSIVGAFNGTAGQMTVTFAGGVTTVLLDVDGDARADYRLRINGDATSDTGNWAL
jgi:Ca2+-binding RTX toxin-like protein